MTPTLPSTETAGLPFESDGPMYRGADDDLICEVCGRLGLHCGCEDWWHYGDYDLPEENARARELVAKIEGWPQIADCLVALLIIGATLLGLRAVNAEPGKMLSMFSGPVVSEVVPTIYAPTTPYKRKPQ